MSIGDLMEKAWIYGLDGGGTACRLRVERATGALIWKGESSGANPRSVGWEGAETVLNSLFSDLYASTGLDPSACAGGFAGMAGIGRAGDRERMRDLVKRVSRVACPVEADMDALPALVGALGRKEGILLVAGTGSVAVGVSTRGRIVRAGGWGHILGDEGSAFDVGRKGLDAAIRHFEARGPETSLLGRALDYFRIPEAFQLIPAVYEAFDKSRIAGFAREVSEAGGSGDAVAISILEGAAVDLRALVVSVAERLSGELENKAIALSGGFIENEACLRSRVAALLKTELPDYRLAPVLGDAAAGACALARELGRSQKGRT
jgi:N-acetylglucosamine kinase-like BadF-type ATPase